MSALGGRVSRAARCIETSALVVGLAVLAGCGSTHPSAAPTIKPTPSASPKPAATKVTASVAPWHLPFAIAREGVVPLSATKVLVGGGMFPDDTSSARAFTLDLATGQASTLPSLSVDVHDVAGGLYGGKPAIYGGGNASEQSTIQQYQSGAWRVVAHMPTTRSDLSVGTVGGTTYVLGGYDGTGVPTQVLAQSGNSLRPAGHLVEGVRYAATAVLGSSIYLFGGEVSGAELSVVQKYDTTTHRTTVVA
ncbi:MAG: hypothetical protein ACTHJM_08910, partial [Marmoricola sp.]